LNEPFPDRRQPQPICRAWEPANPALLTDLFIPDRMAKSVSIERAVRSIFLLSAEPNS
jgi:hypothetical protein